MVTGWGWRKSSQVSSRELNWYLLPSQTVHLGSIWCYLSSSLVCCSWRCSSQTELLTLVIKIFSSPLRSHNEQRANSEKVNTKDARYSHEFAREKKKVGCEFGREKRMNNGWTQIHFTTIKKLVYVIWGRPSERERERERVLNFGIQVMR